jgi:hypothetical protein
VSTRVKRRSNLILLRSRNGRIHDKETGDRLVGQVDLEELILRRREVTELEEKIAVALSTGARVETGIHTAELVPERRRAGRELFLKLVVLLLLLTVLPAVCSRTSVMEDVNGDGKIDVLDFIESASGISNPSSAEKGVRPNA